jgi:8-oxo-dGTP diphosphatase
MTPVLKMNSAAETAYDRVSGILPFDTFEKDLIEDTCAWIQSGVPIVRIKKPDVPNKHLSTYFVLFDEKALKILFVNHKNAGLWLPPGGHVEGDENPSETVVRECVEELGIEAHFWREGPVFLTLTETVGLTAGHTDVNLWYILKGNHQSHFLFDTKEFNTIKWFGFDEIPYEQSDSHLRRFMSKLNHLLCLQDLET